MIQKINITEPGESLLNLGRKQWECLNALSEHYKNADMSKISKVSSFEDDDWKVIGTSTYDFRWAKWSEKKNCYPLILVCKVICYQLIQVQNFSISSIKNEVAAFLNGLNELFEAKSILTSKKNQPFNIPSQLTADDITLFTQSYIVKNKSAPIKIISFLNRLSKASTDTFPNAEFLVSAITTPWKEQSLSVTDWAEQLKATVGVFTTKTPYSPLPFETVSLLIQRAIPIITEHFDTITGIFTDIEEFHKERPPYEQRRVNVYIDSIIKHKYGKDIEKILPFDVYTKHKQYNGMVTASWYSDLEQLAQGAAAWIILLTTGLRNFDMRNLEKGCCQPSKRHDLINYLITDIKKTNLKNYVLPVPELTRKAVKLAELAKIDRSGQFLFSKNHSKTCDNTSSDKRKMNTGATFNDMIRSFANRYGIPLQTISQNEDEATTHCVRATLAGYIGANSTAAILILKRLFGHSNALMPDAYLSHNPIVISERNKNIINSQESLAEDMAQGMVSGKLSGTKGKQMLIGAEHIKANLKTELANESVNEMDMQIKLKDRIKEILLCRMQENQIYALKTPMSVACIRSCNDSSDTPCAKLPNREKRKESGVKKEITDALATLPNPAHCVGKECSDALFGEAWSRDLLGTFDYYIKYLKGTGHQSIDMKNEAQLFVKNYGSILKDIYATERKEGYFD
ncbi:MAG: hypothetical protein ACPGR2_12820 [Psychrobium sp.]